MNAVRDSDEHASKAPLSSNFPAINSLVSLPGQFTFLILPPVLPNPSYSLPMDPNDE